MGLTGIPPAAFMRGGDPLDPRSVRTRGQLLDAFERLVDSGETPTVAELAREAGISRSSFYGHFTGIEEVGVAAVRAILDQFEPRSEPDSHGRSPHSVETSFQDLFSHLDAHRSLCAAVLASEQQVPALAELRSVLVAHLTNAIKRAPSRPSSVDCSDAAAFLVGGMLALFNEQLQHPSGSPLTVGATVAAMMPEWLLDSGVLDSPLLVTPSGVTGLTVE